MRKVLFQEGKIAPNNLFVEVGAIQFDPTKKYPITLQWDQPPVGRVSDIRRENDQLTGEIEWGSEYDESLERDHILSAYCDQLKAIDNGKRIVEATMRGFNLVYAPPAAARSWAPDVSL